MRALDLSLLVIVLSPLTALAQEAAPPVAADAPASADVAPQPSPVAPLPVPAAPPPVAATPPPVAFAPAPQLQPSAPPATVFAPQASPLLPPAAISQPAPYYPVPVYPQAQPRPYYYYAQPPEPPSYVLPPLPPGYVYMPVPTSQATSPASRPEVADGSRRQQLYEQLREADLRLSELERQHIGVGGPITLMVLGYGSTFISGLVALSSYGAADRIKRRDYDIRYDEHELDINNDGQINGRDSRRFHKMGRIALGVGAASLFVGIASTVRLVKRRAERQQRARELKSVTAERDALRRQLDFGPSVSGGQLGVQLQGRY